MRNEEIREQLKEELAARQSQSQERLRTAYEQDREKYIGNFLKAMDSLFRKCKEKQEKRKASGMTDDMDAEGLEGIEYICMHCLRVSEETETYEYGLRAYDSFLYCDKDGAEESYAPAYRKEILEEDKQYIEKLVMSKVIRAKQYEVVDLQKWYLWNSYIKPMPPEMEDAVERIKELESYRELDKEEGITLYYGELMETPEREYRL